MKKCILIFDDDPAILLVCKIILEKQNYRVETRTDCASIIHDIKIVRPDLVLMDLWIPETGGEGAINLIRRTKEIQNLPVILFSANGTVEEVANRCHATGFLKKPFEISSLQAIIEKNIVKDLDNSFFFQ